MTIENDKVAEIVIVNKILMGWGSIHSYSKFKSTLGFSKVKAKTAKRAIKYIKRRVAQ